MQNFIDPRAIKVTNGEISDTLVVYNKEYEASMFFEDRYDFLMRTALERIEEHKHDTIRKQELTSNKNRTKMKGFLINFMKVKDNWTF